MEHVGNQLKKAIKERGLTQEAAAHMLGITRQTIGQWFKRSSFDANTLHDVKSKLGIVLDSELGTESKQPDSINVPREVFDKMSRLIDTVCSQQDTIAEQHRTIERLIVRQGCDAGANVREDDVAGSADVK